MRVDRPFARVGADSSNEFRVRGQGIPAKCIYLHTTPQGTYCLSLNAQLPDEAAFNGWLDSMTTPQLAGVRLTSEKPSDAASNSQPDLRSPGSAGPNAPELTISFLDGVQTATYRITRALTLVGRARPSNIELTHLSVSGVHCLLYWDGQVLWVVDLLSRRGTHLNGERIECDRIAPGDVLSVGYFRMWLNDPTTPPREFATTQENPAASESVAPMRLPGTAIPLGDPSESGIDSFIAGESGTEVALPQNEKLLNTSAEGDTQGGIPPNLSPSHAVDESAEEVVGYGDTESPDDTSLRLDASKVKELQHELDSSREAIRGLESAMMEMEAERKRLHEAKVAAEDKAKALRRQLDDQTLLTEKISHEVDECRRMIQVREANTSQEQDAQQKLETRCERLTAEVSQLRQEASHRDQEFEHALKSAKEEVQQLTSALATLQATADLHPKVEAQAAELVTQLESSRRTIQEFESTRGKLDEQVRSAKEQVDSLEVQLLDTLEKSEQFEQDLRQSEERHALLQQELNKVAETATNRQQENQNLIEKVREQSAKIADEQKQLASLQRELKVVKDGKKQEAADTARRWMQLQSQLESEISARRKEREKYEAEIKQLREGQGTALSAAAQKLEQEMAGNSRKHEESLAVLADQHAQALTSAAQKHAAELDAERQKQVLALKSAKDRTAEIEAQLARTKSELQQVRQWARSLATEFQEFVKSQSRMHDLLSADREAEPENSDTDAPSTSGGKIIDSQAAKDRKPKPPRGNPDRGSKPLMATALDYSQQALPLSHSTGWIQALPSKPEGLEVLLHRVVHAHDRKFSAHLRRKIMISALVVAAGVTMAWLFYQYGWDDFYAWLERLRYR